ncbi:MAG: aspartate/glutamate racemase family protein [Deltaproteobacteria bacterium]|nr:aspartate/glutamate racemase family protein [Deltaproteobacteria bacterium]
MKTIGLIGGMSWESSIEYYRLINEGVRERLGGLHSAQGLMYSVDFAEIEALQRRGEWAEATEMMVDAARRLERGGADFVVICTNTMHLMADKVEGSIRIPLLHIADATAEELKAKGLKKVGLLGTRFTMEQDFYRGRLEARHHLEVITPGEEDKEIVHRVIYEELCMGKIRASSRAHYVRIMNRLVEAGAQGIVLGCTEIGLLVQANDCTAPLFDTTRIHAQAAVDYALR